jgi:hypothetical protein
MPVVAEGFGGGLGIESEIGRKPSLLGVGLPVGGEAAATSRGCGSLDRYGLPSRGWCSGGFAGLSGSSSSGNGSVMGLLRLGKDFGIVLGGGGRARARALSQWFNWFYLHWFYG